MIDCPELRTQSAWMDVAVDTPIDLLTHGFLCCALFWDFLKKMKPRFMKRRHFTDDSMKKDASITELETIWLHFEL